MFNLLEEEGHAVVLVNPQPVKAVPGHKTAASDSRWLTDLVRHGLLPASCIPPATSRQLRDLTRYRKALVRERTHAVKRLQTVLESANSKLAGVATDILGVSGRQMVSALATGEDAPAALADRARGQLRKKLEALGRALEGRVRPHQRVLIHAILQHVTFLERSLEELDAEVDHALAPFAAERALLQQLPGVTRTAAATISAEIGVDRGRFASAAHLASWAGGCPGKRQSGGKRLRSHSTTGNPWLRGLLGEGAWAAVRQKDTAFGARFPRLARRQNKQKALVAVMHHLLIVIYHMLRDHAPYQELGPDYFRPHDPQRRAKAPVSHLEHLGYVVTLIPKEVA